MVAVTTAWLQRGSGGGSTAAAAAVRQPWQHNSSSGGCENILCGYLYDGDLVFVILKGIYGFKFPKGFWRSLPEISLLLFFFCQS
jgi:hypothetical protein